MGQVHIGPEDSGRTVEIQRFSGFKGLLALDVLKEIAGAVPDLEDRVEAYVRRFRAENEIVLNRATARFEIDPEELAQLDLVTDEDWERSGHELRFRRSPNAQRIGMHLFPHVYKLARDKVVQLIALVTTENRELEEWDLSDKNVDQELDKAGKKILHDSMAEDLVRLLVVAVEVCQEQLTEATEELGGRVGEALAALGIGPDPTPPAPTPDPTGPQPGPEPTPAPDPPEAPQEPAASKLTSSTASPAPTDGDEPEPSTEPAGSSSALSAAG